MTLSCNWHKMQLRCNKNPAPPRASMPAALDLDGPAAAHPDGPAPQADRRSGNGGRPAQLLRRLHLWAGAILTLNFILLVITGLCVQHRDWLQLEGRTVSRTWLPSGYRPHDPETEIRADIVLTDLHSGRLFGAWGPLMVDLAAAGFLFMIASGFIMQVSCKYRNRRHTL